MKVVTHPNTIIKRMKVDAVMATTTGTTTSIMIMMRRNITTIMITMTRK